MCNTSGKIYEKALEVFLSMMVKDGDINSEDMTHALYWWNRLKEYSNGQLTVPGASVGPDNCIFFAWGNNEHCLDLTINGYYDNEFFYTNTNSYEIVYWSIDNGCLDTPKTALYLPYFYRHNNEANGNYLPLK